jgi:predicted protein tyrosine phosphatase
MDCRIFRLVVSRDKGDAAFNIQLTALQDLTPKNRRVVLIAPVPLILKGGLVGKVKIPE